MFNKDLYLEALNILYWDSCEDDDRWDDFVERNNISPYDLILDLILKESEWVNYE